MRKNSSFNHFVMLATAAVAMLMASCIKDEVVDVPFIPTESETIGFGINLENLDDTRAASRNRVGKHDLKSADGEFTLPMGVYVEDGIGCADAAETRGAKLDAIGNSFTVWASLANGDTSTLFFPAVGVAFENDGTSYKSNPAYFWPGAGTLNFTAVANAPESGFVPNLNTAGTALESFTYTVPANATAQNDIVVATLNGVNGSANSTQALDFKHIMSAVQFKVGTKMAQGKIKSITLNNIYKTGTYDIATGVWTPQADSKGSYSVTFSNAQNDGSFEPNVGAGTVINAGTATFMLLPQQLADDVQLVVTFIYDNATDKEVTLSTYISKKSGAGEGTSNYIWEKGKTTCYAISVDENYNLDVYQTKGEVLDAHYVMTDITINVDTQDDQPWTLTVEATNIDVAESGDVSIQFTDNLNTLIKDDGYWIDKLIDNTNSGAESSARGAKTLTGKTKGEYKVKLFLPENISAEDRKITLTLSLDSDPDNAKKEFVLYQKYPYWDEEKLFGWEKIENHESGSYGFIWDRVVCYEMVYNMDRSHELKWYDDDLFNELVDPLIEKYNAGYYVAKRSVYNSAGLSSGRRNILIIDYTKLRVADYMNTFSEEDGFVNTKSFFNTADVMAFEMALSNVMKVESGLETQAMFEIRSDNGTLYKFGDYNWAGRPKTEEPYVSGNNVTYNNEFGEVGNISDMSGILDYIIKRNSFNATKNTFATGVIYEVQMSADNIKWYLPAKNQYLKPVLSFATGNPTFTPANFWSSTADASNNANAFNGAGKSESRETLHQVVVQRIPKDGIIPTAPATVEIDNTSMDGGENGEAQWVE